MRFALLSLALLWALASQPSPAISGLLEVEDELAIRIHLVEGGAVRVMLPWSDGWMVVDEVSSFDLSPREGAFTASRWGRVGEVVATSVNAVHLLFGVKGGRGVTYSLFPAGLGGGRGSIVLKSPPGRGLFSLFYPSTGYLVLVERGIQLIVDPEGAMPLAEGDELILFPQRAPEDPPLEARVENWEGGAVEVLYLRSGWKRVATVARPVRGVGRFAGSLYQGVGGVRANHPGVICVSTSPFGQVGGFQVIPYGHSFSPEMREPAWSKAQWMILRPTGERPLEGDPPLFYGHLLPSVDRRKALREERWDFWLLRNSLVMEEMEGGKLRRLREGVGLDDDALEGVRVMRIFFPLHRLWREDFLER